MTLELVEKRCGSCMGSGWTGARHQSGPYSLHYHCRCGAPCKVDAAEGCTGGVDPGPRDWPAEIRAALDILERAKTNLDDVVRLGHSHGLSWAAVGAEVGTSRQSAWERFAHKGASR